MVYSVPFFRLVIGGTIYSETWNTSLGVVASPNQPADAAILDLLADAVEAWFISTGTTGAQFLSYNKLTYIKFNRIDANGHYQDQDSQTHEYTTPIPGGTAQATGNPSQLAVVATLRTAFTRGLANRGRMYLPTSTGYPNVDVADGRATAANAIRVASSTSTLINSINAAMSTWQGGGDAGSVGVFSNQGAGAWHSVTHVQAGRITDSMRSRRNSLDEDYQDSTIAIS